MIIYLAYWILIFTAVQFIVALSNLLTANPFAGSVKGEEDLVSVLIPARNEERNIGALLHDLSCQDYSNIEILVFNDLSTDRTAGIVTQCAGSDDRIRLIESEGLPAGWLGKNYACHTLSSHASGKFLMFLDADVRAASDLVAGSVAYMKRYDLGLLTIFPKQIMVTIGEKITVPVMNYVLLTLLPLILVRISRLPAFAAANGQFMLFNARTYYSTLPHYYMKSTRVEDIGIARWYKWLDIKMACVTGTASVVCRMYSGFSEAVSGFSRSVASFFGNSYPLAVLFWLTTTFGFLPVVIALPMKVTAIYLLIIAVTRVMVSVTSRQSTAVNLICIIPQQLALGAFILKAMVNSYKKSFEWKGRDIS
jgi:hypothetical protein